MSRITVGGERHYGLNVGDQVNYPTPKGCKGPYVVIEKSILDNNRVYLRDVTDPQAKPWPAVAEWCRKIEAEKRNP